MNIEAQAWQLNALNLFFPQFCQACGQGLLTEENGYFCPRCWEGSPRIKRPFCSRCGRPHPDAVGFGSRSNFPCPECRDKPLPHIDRIWGAAHYDEAMALAIRLFKFGGKTRLALPLAEIMAEFAQEELDCHAYDLLVPVPLHPVRYRERGFNQSHLLAEALKNTFPSALVDASLRRIRPTRTQSLLQGRQRRDSVRGAFAVQGDACQNKPVLLIDDVVTTGGTVSECARVLKVAGATRVDVLAAALTVHRQDKSIDAKNAPMPLNTKNG
jgi:ComF family protein